MIGQQSLWRTILLIVVLFGLMLVFADVIGWLMPVVLMVASVALLWEARGLVGQWRLLVGIVGVLLGVLAVMIVMVHVAESRWRAVNAVRLERLLK